MIGNPVFYKELLLRMPLRQNKASLAGVVASVMLALALIYWLIFWWLLSSREPENGSIAWFLVTFFQYTLIFLHTPSVTANAITQEKEQQTWEMLVFTRLRPSEIILGKLLARQSSTLLILLAFLPISLFSWLYSLQDTTRVGLLTPPISLAQFVLAYVVMIITALFFSTVGLLMSALLKRTLYALLAAYTFLIGLLTIGTFLLTTAIAALGGSLNFENSPLLWINPIAIMTTVFSLNSRGEGNLNAPLIVGPPVYLLLTVCIVWLLIANFRRYAYE